MSLYALRDGPFLTVSGQASMKDVAGNLYGGCKWQMRILRIPLDHSSFAVPRVCSELLQGPSSYRLDHTGQGINNIKPKIYVNPGIHLLTCNFDFESKKIESQMAFSASQFTR